MRTVKTKFKYADDSTRIYTFDCEDSLAPDVKDHILEINASLQASTDGGLASFFVSDNGDDFVIISGATIESSESVPIEIAPNS